MSQYDTSKWRAIQRELATKVIEKDCFNKPPKLIAGLDTAYSGDEAFSAIVVLDYETLETLETKTAQCTVEVPYIPTFLSFREAEPITKAIGKLSKATDVFLVHAHGVAHPQRCGFASHLGVTLDIPVIGVANELLYGKISDSGSGETRYLKDAEEIIGAALLSGAGFKPIYVSVGHKVSLESAIEIVKKTTKGSRLPEPLRLAHVASNEAKEKWRKGASQENRGSSR
nr:endonuclease V [Candidatus Njordarchaeota archaeon]